MPRSHIKVHKRADANFYRYGYHGNYGIGENELKAWRDYYEIKHRKGILHHPGWLISFSDNEKNQAIQRGRWITTKLLGGYVPDAPVAVDAQLPNDPHKTLREKMVVTREKECWACHRNMDDQGLPFEQFDFIGQFRNQELLRPIVTSGVLKLPLGEQVQVLEIKDTYDYVEILSESKHVQQVFFRHVFGYFMGRNETLEDAYTLQSMDEAYSKQGSLKAAVKTLFLSDSFTIRL